MVGKSESQAEHGWKRRLRCDLACFWGCDICVAGRGQGLGKDTARSDVRGCHQSVACWTMHSAGLGAPL